MSYEPLHHKYRPQSFAQLVGQQAIAATLSNALRQRRIAPAYLFTGARGTGKTSSARIFAKSLNCLQSDMPTDAPCGKCEICQAIARGSALDVIEIDAASNTGVDNIRELIERAQFAPVQCRYKVYVIDEVHMLSTAAFNALLKTLEEPPDRVVFVLATTDPQKILPTIISRCQRFDFRRIPLEDMVAHLEAIAQKEGIPITVEAVQLVAQISLGGMRDAESLLDQLSLLEGEITVDRVWDLVGAVPERDLMDLLQAIAQDDPATVLDRARNLMDRGREPLIVLQNLASFYRDLLIAKAAPNRNDLVAITPPTWEQLCDFAQNCEIGWITAGQQHLRTAEVQVKNTSQPRLWMEVTVLGLLPSAIQTREVGTQPARPQSTPPVPPRPIPTTQGEAIAPPTPAPAPAPVPPPSSSSPPASPPPSSPPSSPPPSPPPEEPPPVPSVPELSPDLKQLWQDVLKLVEPFSTQMMLRQQCHLIAFNGSEARVGTRSKPLFKMAKDRMPNIEAAFAKQCGKSIRVTLEVASGEAAPTADYHPAPPKEERSPQPSPPPTSAPPEETPPTAPPPPEQPPVSPSPAQDPSSSPTAIPPPSPDAPDFPTPPLHWEAEDEVLRAAKSLAQMFNGQIVDLDHDPILPSEGGDSTPPTDPASLEDDEEDDVPF